MPHTPSAKKRLRQIAKRRLRNRAVMKGIKLQIRALTDVAKVKESTKEQVGEQLRLAVKKLDKAAAKRVIHPNQAARRKSQLYRLVNERQAAPAAS